VDSQIITLQGAGVDSLIIAATPKAAAQAIRKVYDLGWAPERYLATIAQSIATVLKPAGIEKSMGVITNLWSKDPTDPRWKDDPGCKEWAAFDLLGLQPIERDVLKLEMRRHQPSDRGDRCEVGFVSQNDEVSEFAEQSLDGRIGRHHQDRTLAQADAWQGHDTDEPAGGGHEGAKLIDRRAGEEADDGLLGAKRQPDQPGHMLGAHREENDIAFGDHGFIAVFADHPLVSRRKRTGAGLGPGGQVDLVVRISLAAARNPCTTASVIAPVPINPKLAIG
jgi:hypothetical protein